MKQKEQIVAMQGEMTKEKGGKKVWKKRTLMRRQYPSQLITFLFERQHLEYFVSLAANGRYVR